ncbi:fibrous sheath CABYR-binding protein-like [Sycon ciliatum]|uniref:fibrous sheath CABYR-binding protein-like n=1 Tax=Sycon ciliatum TaxID=27933 RepID=UPI0031F6C599
MATQMFKYALITAVLGTALVASWLPTGSHGMPTPGASMANSTDDNVTCPFPPIIDNGEVSNDTDEAMTGDFVSYTCDSGYQWLHNYAQMVNIEIRCFDGNWTNVDDECTDINECDPKTGEGRLCDSCLNTNGSFVCQCGHLRTLIGSRCHATCGPLQSFLGTNSTIGEMGVVGSQVFFQCPEGLAIRGALSTTCESNASATFWSHPVPICEQPAEKSSALSTGAIVGIVTGLAGLAVMVALAVWCITRSKKEMHREMDRKRSLVSLRLQEEKHRRESEVSLVQSRKPSTVTSDGETQFLGSAQPAEAPIAESQCEDLSSKQPAPSPEKSSGEQEELVKMEEDIGVSTPPSTDGILDTDVVNEPAGGAGTAEECVNAQPLDLLAAAAESAIPEDKETPVVDAGTDQASTADTPVVTAESAVVPDTEVPEPEAQESTEAVETVAVEGLAQDHEPGAAVAQNNHVDPSTANEQEKCTASVAAAPADQPEEEGISSAAEAAAEEDTPETGTLNTGDPAGTKEEAGETASTDGAAVSALGDTSEAHAEEKAAVNDVVTGDVHTDTLEATSPDPAQAEQEAAETSTDLSAVPITECASTTEHVEAVQDVTPTETASPGAVAEAEEVAPSSQEPVEASVPDKSVLQAVAEVFFGSDTSSASTAEESAGHSEAEKEASDASSTDSSLEAPSEGTPEAHAGAASAKPVSTSSAEEPDDTTVEE